MDEHAAPQPPATEDVWHPRLSRTERHERFARNFSDEQMRSLKDLGCTTAQIDRLRISLRVIAASTTPAIPAPKLADVRAPLDDLAKKAKETAKALESLLKAPESNDARTEAKERLRDAIFSLYPDRCRPDPHKVGFYNDYDECIEEAKRLLDKVHEVEKIAAKAREDMPTKATRARIQTRPIGHIHSALSFNFAPTPRQPKELIPPSVSITSPFRKIVGICYEAAGATTADPERAIRAYYNDQKKLDKGSENSTTNRPSKRK
ncbi:hypothetical protein [Rhodanobacter hydrolyticus]|uniref:Uncharacterized protein n=1 Tax=Rhodanobacter hydrolyticus TaxID=2250595 RepID=A0ABW8J3K7_9GAMM